MTSPIFVGALVVIHDDIFYFDYGKASHDLTNDR
jgi:hypothetical protein